MTSIERIKSTFHRERIDRVGIVDFYWGLTVPNWKKRNSSAGQRGLIPDYSSKEGAGSDLR